MKKLAKAMSAFLVICMLMATMTAVTFAAIADGTYWTMATEGDVTIGNSTKVMLLEEVVSGGQATVTEKTGVTFTSSDTTIAEIVDGKIVGKKAGVVKIKAEPGFNPNNPRNDYRSMLVVVGNGAESTTNYDTESGSGTESLGGYNNLPYSYVAYPRRGLTGKSLSLDPLEASKASDYGMALNQTHNTNKDFYIIQPGKISEFWMMNGKAQIPFGINPRWFDFVFPSGARMKVDDNNGATSVCYLSPHNQSNTFAYYSIDGYGSAPTYIGMNVGQWVQYVIDGSEVDASTGAGVYKVYVNGGLKFTHTATGGVTTMPVSFYRNLKIDATGAGSDSHNFYVDDIKIYELPESVSNTVTVGKGGSVKINGTTYTEGTATLAELSKGGSLTIETTPENGYVLDTITYNGTTVDGNVVTIAKDGAINVSFKLDGTRDERTEYTIATDGNLLVNRSVNMVLTQNASRIAESTGRQMTDVATQVTSGVTYTSSDESVVSVVNGVATGKKMGTAKISAIVNETVVASMLVVVGGSVEAENNYNGSDLPTGEQVEKLSSAQGGTINGAYEYVTAPAHGLGGKSMFLKQIKNADPSNALTSPTSGVNWIQKGDVFANGGKSAKGTVTEFWFYNSRANAYRANCFWINLGSHSVQLTLQHTSNNIGRGEFGWPSHNQWWAKGTAAREYGNDTSVGLYSASYTMKTGWNQIVINGSEVLANGGVKYKLYVNGDNAMNVTVNPSDTRTIEEGLEAITVIRTLLNGTTDTNDVWVDDYKVYSMVDANATTNTLSVGDGGKVTVDGTNYTGANNTLNVSAGATLNFTVTPDANKVIDKITYNGQELVNTMTSVTVVKDATLSVTFKDDPAVATPAVSLYTSVPANTTPDATQPFSTHTVYGTLSGWKNIEGYGMKLSDGTEFVLMEGKMEGDPWTWLEESQGRFAFRVYGEGIVGKTCTMTPYITVDGSNTFGEASDEFTGSMAE